MTHVFGKIWIHKEWVAVSHLQLAQDLIQGGADARRVEDIVHRLAYVNQKAYARQLCSAEPPITTSTELGELISLAVANGIDVRGLAVAV